MNMCVGGVQSNELTKGQLSHIILERQRVQSESGVCTSCLLLLYVRRLILAQLFVK